MCAGRPTRLMKGFWRAANPAAHRIKTSSSLPGHPAGLRRAAFLFTLLYRKDAGTAFTALAGVLLLGAPLAVR